LLNTIQFFSDRMEKYTDR